MLHDRSPTARRGIEAPLPWLAVLVAGTVAAAAFAREPCDQVSRMQAEAETAGRAPWGHWGEQPDRYAGWSNHSNRLIPVYAFGMTLDEVSGPKSGYRDEAKLEELYGRLPEHTLNPSADYFDQTDIHRLQRSAVDAGKKIVVLFVFDGLDWPTTRTAAIAARGKVEYSEGRGTGLSFQDYAGTTTDFGFCVTSPANDGTAFDVDAQAIRNPGGERPGGYDAERGGATPWDPRASMRYLTGRDRDVPHPFTDSAASATSLCSGRKTYNDAINVGPSGEMLEPIARVLQSQGWAVGAVSSVPVSHATPACAYANNVSRDDYQDISRDLVGEPSITHRDPLPGLDLLIGGGHGVVKESEADQGRNFEPGNKYVSASTLAAIDAANGGRYRVVTRTAGRRGGELLAEAARDAISRKLRLFGFFGAAEGHLPFRTADGDYEPGESRFDADRDGIIDPLHEKYGGTIRYTPEDVTENPTLAEMATAAMDVLSAKGPFWLMVEAGDVDWACHANNIDTCIGAIQSGDDAFRAVVGWIERHDAWEDAVVIVTSDHGHPFVLVDPAAFAAGLPAAAEHWPQWRGPRNDGISLETGLSGEWSKSKNVGWRTPLPGSAGATPCVWGDRIFLTSNEGDDLVLLCIATADGTILWKRKVTGGNQDARAGEGNSASPSPSTDGRHVWAFFSTGVLACYSIEGDEVWKFDVGERFGRIDIQFGMTSTPVLDGDALYLQLIHGAMKLDDQTRTGKVVKLDKTTGRTLWEVDRVTEAQFECKHSYASPVLYRHDGREFLVVHGADCTTGHALDDGRELWRFGGLNGPTSTNPKPNDNTFRFVASPAAAPGTIVIPTAKNGPTVAIRVGDDLQGDCSGKEAVIRWVNPLTPDVSIPLIADGLVYMLHKDGKLQCVDLETGKDVYLQRTHTGQHRTSPLLVEGRIWFGSNDGWVSTVKAGREFELLDSVDLDGEAVTASPIVSDGTLYVRSYEALYAIRPK